MFFFFFSSRRRHTRCSRDWSSDVCSSDLKDSPYRNRSVEESLDLFARMRAGEFKDGAHVLRAKIDMASPNVNMRDPTMRSEERRVGKECRSRWSPYH